MRALALALGLLWCTLAQALSGEVVRVSDGDTIWVRPAAGGKPVKVRVQGIDAPERCQPWGAEAREALARRVLNRQVQVRTRAYDDYRRALGDVMLDGADVGRWMVREGHAWSYRYRRSPGPYPAEEAEARAAGRGLFADRAAIEPRHFRKAHGPCPDPSTKETP